MLEPNAAQTVAISLHELATNAAKYGSLSATDGRVEITWSRDDGRTAQFALDRVQAGRPSRRPRTAGSAGACRGKHNHRPAQGRGSF